MKKKNENLQNLCKNVLDLQTQRCPVKEIKWNDSFFGSVA